jgi:hypothetical protein
MGYGEKRTLAAVDGAADELPAKSLKKTRNC